MRRQGEMAVSTNGDPETGGGDRDSKCGSGAGHDPIKPGPVDRRMSPNYATSTAVFAETWDGKTAVVLATGLTVNVGDVIEYDEGHIDPSDPCQYVPNFAVSRH